MREEETTAKSELAPKPFSFSHSLPHRNSLIIQLKKEGEQGREGLGYSSSYIGQKKKKRGRKREDVEEGRREEKKRAGKANGST